MEDREEGAYGNGGSGKSETDTNNDAENALCACFDLLARLAILSTNFSQQFLKEGGLVDLVSAGVLLEACPATLATSALEIASQLARDSADNYPRLHATGVDTSLGALLAHADPTVRAKACNLVGNFCRHSSFFYASFGERRRTTDEQAGEEAWRVNPHSSATDAPGSSFGRDAPRARRNDEIADGTSPGGEDLPSLLKREPEEAPGQRPQVVARAGRRSVADHLARLCADPDPSTRKLACFAVGNAAFHSNTLYAHLAPAVASLVVALGDPNERTRANAAGALGNLVRNGGSLSGDLARQGGVAALLKVAVQDPATPARRIALFSLGTCCAFAPCREALALMEREGAGGKGSALRAVAPDGGTPESQRRSGGDGGGRQRWNVGPSASAVPLRPGSDLRSVGGGTFAGLDRRLLVLKRAAEEVPDDVALKYIARLRAKLSAPMLS